MTREERVSARGALKEAKATSDEKAADQEAEEEEGQDGDHSPRPEPPSNVVLANTKVVRLVIEGSTARNAAEETQTQREQRMTEHLQNSFAGIREIYFTVQPNGLPRTYADVPICQYNHGQIVKAAAAGVAIRLAAPRIALSGIQLQHPGTGSVLVCDSSAWT